MDEVIFELQGSAPQPYIVTFRRIDAEVHGSCTCPAGLLGTYCKHRLALLYGRTDAPTDADVDRLATLHSWLPGTALQGALSELADAERVLAAANARVARAKKALGRSLG